MKIILYIITGAYAFLHALAAMMHAKDGRNAADILMIAGSVAVIVGIALGLADSYYDLAAAAVGTVLIVATAISNGRRSESFHIKHHVIRAAVSAAIVAGFALL